MPTSRTHTYSYMVGAGTPVHVPFSHVSVAPTAGVPATLGAISEKFDQQLFQWMEKGRGAELAGLTSADLRDHGGVEMRQWIVLQGALGSHKPESLVYEPFYRAVLAMAVAYWDLQDQTPLSF